MNQARGVLMLADPLCGCGTQMQNETGIQTLIFHENERYLLQAQTALQAARQRWGWVCVAADGAAAGIAAALAAQLPVDRLALRGSTLFSGRRESRNRLRRIEAFARCNLALIAAPVLLADCGPDEIRGWLRGLGHGEICALDGHAARDCWPQGLCAPWRQMVENNLLIPGKRV